ncbi:hypothetical protein DN752_00555 [Echinicola strongylocentroti]|uniref:Uncharacterized protein n=1 Tax=Echinicola strongylocentroti TaxID=1795355 RepID=A0A2Z4ID96_9BACT|nr:hypothetical protein [Echinicola strongylocentroti]AWW28745.1 hypothetical protein DN752_00555 [Echinicola strongylocentroti]
MRPGLIILLLFASFSYSPGQSSIPPKDIQIKVAVLAAPEENRKGAKVYGYNAQGEFTVLREGENEMICIGDDPKQNGLSVACYQEDLEPFMQRGRELKKEGKSFREIFDIREEEVQAGSLTMPDNGATLFVLTADEKEVDWSKGKVLDGNFRYVVYIPYATVESTGLPLKPEAPGMPWIMDPGTHRAHIMITPPKD